MRSQHVLAWLIGALAFVALGTPRLWLLATLRNSCIRRAVVVAVAFVCLLGCSADAFRTYREVIEFEPPQPDLATTRVVRSFASHPGYDRLRLAAMQRFPELSEEESHGLEVLMGSMRSQAKGGAEQRFVIVGLGYRGKDFDPKPIVRFCREFIENEIRLERSRGGGTQLGSD